MPVTAAGPDGTGVNAKSWATIVKEGIMTPAPPQGKARPHAFQQIANTNRDKSKLYPDCFVCLAFVCVCVGSWVVRGAELRIQWDDHQVGVCYFCCTDSADRHVPLNIGL